MTFFKILILFTVIIPILSGSFYDNSNVTNLNSENFRQFVFGQDHIVIVNFYLRFCGHCVSFSESWKKLADDMKGWKPVVQLAAMDCTDQNNNQICDKYDLIAFPKMKAFWINSNDNDKGYVIPYESTDDISLRHQVIDYIIGNLNKAPWTWNRLDPVKLSTKDEIANSLTKSKITLILIEEKKSYFGSEVSTYQTKLD